MVPTTRLLNNRKCLGLEDEDTCSCCECIESGEGEHFWNSLVSHTYKDYVQSLNIVNGLYEADSCNKGPPLLHLELEMNTRDVYARVNYSAEVLEMVFLRAGSFRTSQGETVGAQVTP